MLEVNLGSVNKRDDAFWKKHDLKVKNNYTPALFMWIDCLLDANTTRIIFDMKSNPRFVE